MRKSSLNTNKQFLVGNGLLAFGVFVVIVLFLYISFRFKRDADKVVTYDGVYHIEMARDFAGDSISVYLNDSLLLNRILPDTITEIKVNRFAEDNVLMIVDNRTDRTTPFNLKKEGSRVKVKKNDGMISILEREADASR